VENWSQFSFEFLYLHGSSVCEVYLVLQRIVPMAARLIPEWLNNSLGHALDWLLTFINPPGSFVFRNNTYDYIYHITRRNERIVEAPIALSELARHQGQEILEVGNVLHHYIKVNHDVLDKYEKRKCVINEDIVDFRPNKRYGLIISVSTIEHVGWDEDPREPRKALRAIDNLMNLLAPSGDLVMTIPVGLNPELEKTSFIVDN